MQVTSTPLKRCDYIKIEGRVDSATAPRLAECMQAVMDENRFKFVLDFGEVTFFSSAGLRVLINVQKTCKRFNRGEVVFANMPPNIHSAFDLAGFTQLFKIYADSVEAVGNF